MKTTKLITLIAAFAIGILAACDDNMYKPEAPVRVENLDLDDEYATGFQAVIGATFNVANKVTVYPEDATVKTENFTSSDPAVATVDGAGKVVARAPGVTTITITVDEQTVQFTLTVISRIAYPVTAIELAQTSFEPDVDQTIDLFSKIHLTPVIAEFLDLTFTSSAPSIAEVDETGTVIGRGTGAATITVTSNANPGVTAQFSLNVYAVDPGFTIDNGVVTAYSGPGGNIRVPGPATSIAARVFQSNLTLTTIHLNNVTLISDYAFNGCTNLTSVNGPNVTTIMQENFHNCVNLEEFIGEKLVTIKNAVFQECPKLERIFLENVIEVGQFGFQHTGLTSIYMPSLTSITNRRRQFSDCAELVTVDMPALKNIGVDMLFQDCTKLKNVNMPVLETMNGTDQGTGVQMFIRCTSLEQISLPSIKQLRAQTFDGCTALTRVDLSQAVNLAEVAANAIPNNATYAGVTVYVASAPIKALFPATTSYTVTVGAPAP